MVPRLSSQLCYTQSPCRLLLSVLGSRSEMSSSAGPRVGVSEKEAKRKLTTTSRYLRARTKWIVIYTGAKPSKAALEATLKPLFCRSSCNLQSFDGNWVEHKATVLFRHECTGSTAKATMMHVMSKALGTTFEPNLLDFDFADDERPEVVNPSGGKAAKTSSPGGEPSTGSVVEALGSLSSGPSGPTPLVPVVSSAGPPSAATIISVAETGAVASAAGASSAQDLPNMALVRGLPFQLSCKAMELLLHPAVPHWLPRPGLEHEKGSFGKVVFGFHAGLQKDVAIKSVGLHAQAPSRTCAHFIQELNLLCAVQGHPNIIELLDVVSTSKAQVGLVFPRFVTALEGIFRHTLKGQSNDGARTRLSIKSGVRILPWSSDVYNRAFQELWSALAFLAQRSIAHSDIKPANVLLTSEETAQMQLVLCDFGNASLLLESCYYEWPREEIEKTTAVEVCSLPYRAPELLFGKADYTVAIDAWSLAVVMTEVAACDFLFREHRTEGTMRAVLRAQADTTGDLSVLKALPWGSERIWRPHRAALVPERASTYLGAQGVELLGELFQLDPARRMTPQQVLEHPYWFPGMALETWAGGSTILQGERGPCQMQVGCLGEKLLELLRADAYWVVDHGRSWTAERGTTVKKDRKRMKVETQAPGEGDEAWEGQMVKMQIAGRCGPLLRGGCQDLQYSLELPAFHGDVFLEAFKRCNEKVWTWLDEQFQRGPMSKMSADELGANGAELANPATKSREWFGNCATIQLTRLHRHAENAHFDGGSAIMLLTVTLWGHRRLTMWDTAGEAHFLDNSPGLVYMSSLCGIKHQVSYDGLRTSGKILPDLGEVGVSILYRTSLFRRSPYTTVRPGPEPVWLEFNRVLQEMHSKFKFRFPTATQFRDLLSSEPTW